MFGQLRFLLFIFALFSVSLVTAQNNRVQCAGTPASRLSLGAHGRTTFTGPTNLRSGPSTNTQIVLSMEEGTEFDVIGGPECGSYTWWQIQLVNGTEGWAAEGDANEYYLEPFEFNIASPLPVNNSTATDISSVPGGLIAVGNTGDVILGDGVINLYDSSARLIHTIPTTNFSQCEFQFSSSGQSLFYLRGTSGTEAQLIEFNLSTRQETVLIPLLLKGKFAISPDGTQIAYALPPELNTSQSDLTRYLYNSSLLVLDLRTGETHELLPPQDGKTPLLPSWSPSGEYIAFRLPGHEGPGPLHVARIHEDGSGEVISTGLGVHDWSPDGDFIVYDYQTAPAMMQRESRLHIAAADGSNPSLLYADPTVSRSDGFQSMYPLWSPNGEYIAFSRRPNDVFEAQSSSLWVINSTTHDLRQLSSSGIPVSWSPDSTQLLAVSFMSGGNLVELVSLDGRPTFTIDRGVCAAWQPSIAGLGIRNPAEITNDVLTSFDALRRGVTNRVTSEYIVQQNVQTIIETAQRYDIDPIIVASIIYWESNSFERLPRNLIELPAMLQTLTEGLLSVDTSSVRSRLPSVLFDLDLWHYLLRGNASVGVGQITVERALYLEERNAVERLVPEITFATDRRYEIAFFIASNNTWAVEYTTANLADIDRIIRELGDGFHFTNEQVRDLIVIGYNIGQECIQEFLLQIAVEECTLDLEAATLEEILNRPYLVEQVKPIYESLSNEF